MIHLSIIRQERSKIEQNVRFPLTLVLIDLVLLLYMYSNSGLDLSSYVINQDHDRPVYDLFSVSNHFGGLGGGHCKLYAPPKLIECIIIIMSL